MVFKSGKQWNGNKNGRPKGSGISVTTEIKKKLQEEYPEDKNKATYLQKIIEVVMEKAIKEKDFHMIKQIWNHVDGLPKHSEVTMNGNFPVPILVEFLDKTIREKNEE